MEQFRILLFCAALGCAGGLLYDLCFCLGYPFRNKYVSAAFEALFCALFAIVYLFVSCSAQLPPLRLYMLAGLVLGFFLYLKSWHKIVAIFAEKVYNSIVRAIDRRRKQRKPCQTKEKFRRKKFAKSR